MAERSKEEEYEAWLDRLEEILGYDKLVRALQQGLKDELGLLYDEQLDALRDAMGLHETLSDMGIHGVRIEYPWGVEVRYGIQGLPGLWGWESVRQIMEAEE